MRPRLCHRQRQNYEITTVKPFGNEGDQTPSFLAPAFAFAWQAGTEKTGKWLKHQYLYPTHQNAPLIRWSQDLPLRLPFPWSSYSSSKVSSFSSFSTASVRCLLPRYREGFGTQASTGGVSHLQNGLGICHENARRQNYKNGGYPNSISK